jgi:hypothetical protein
MTQAPARQALFSGLVYNEDGQLAESTFIGVEPHYVIIDGDFKRHVPAEAVDRQVIEVIQQQALSNKEIVTAQIMTMLKQDDLFTKAMIDSSLVNMERLMEQGMPEDARIMLGMMGFKIIINVHGELVNLNMPAQEAPSGEEW